MSLLLTKKNVKGLTIVELMFALVILAVLAAIAMPYFMGRGKEVCNSSSEATAKDAYIVAQLYFNDYPDGSISSLETLIDMGFRQTKNVNVNVSGNQSDLIITAYHSSGDRTYIIEQDGTITDID